MAPLLLGLSSLAKQRKPNILKRILYKGIGFKVLRFGDAVWLLAYWSYISTRFVFY